MLYENKMNEKRLKNYTRRLKEVLDELEEIGKIFERSANENLTNLENITKSINEIRTPGFRAYHLAQEGLTLLNLIGITIVNNRQKSKELESLDKLEPYLLKTIENMEKFKSLDAKEIIEKTIIKRNNT